MRKVESHRTLTIEGVAVRWDSIREDMEVYRVRYNVTYTHTKPTITQMWNDAENAISGRLVVLSAFLDISVISPINADDPRYNPKYDARSYKSWGKWLDIPKKFQVDGEQKIGY